MQLLFLHLHHHNYPLHYNHLLHHALYYHWDKFNHHERVVALASAKHELERALVAVVLAEKEITSPAKSEPSNVVQIGDHDKEYRNTVDTVASIVGAPQFDGAA